DAPRGAGESCMRHGACDGRHSSLVPADPGGQAVGARFLNLLCEPDGVLTVQAALDQFQRRNTIGENRFVADRLAYRPDHRKRETSPVLKQTAPLVLTRIGPECQKLANEISLRTHYLHA